VKGGTLGRRYARALLDLAGEQGQIERVGTDLRDLDVAWKEGAELREVFENPSFSAASRAAVIDTITTRMGVLPVVRNTLRLLSDRHRIRHLPEVVEAFEELAQEREGRVRAEVITARPMTESYREQLRSTLERVTGKKVVLVTREDPSIIGGVVTRVGDKVFDGSIKHQLAEIRDDLLSH